MTILIGISLSLLTAFGQILLKMGANKQEGHQLLNRYVISGYVVFLLTIGLSYYFMKIIPLKYFTVIMSSSYIVVMIGAKVFLGETITINRFMGTLLIASGIFVFLLK